MSSYAMKYALKQEQKDVPRGYENVGRFWGVYGCRNVLSADTFCSLEDQKNPQVSKLINLIKARLSVAIMFGSAECIVKNDRSYVVVMHNSDTRREIRTLITRLGVQTMKATDMFSYGEAGDLW